MNSHPKSHEFNPLPHTSVAFRFISILSPRLHLDPSSCSLRPAQCWTIFKPVRYINTTNGERAKHFGAIIIINFSFTNQPLKTGYLNGVQLCICSKGTQSSVGIITCLTGFPICVCNKYEGESNEKLNFFISYLIEQNVHNYFNFLCSLHCVPLKCSSTSEVHGYLQEKKKSFG